MILKHLLSFLFLTAVITTYSQHRSTEFYTDTSHYSAVFGHTKQYRIYLPEKYQHSTAKFPVIYFFHGWGGRHFKDDNALLNYEKIKDLVNKYNMILVMWDGNIDTAQPRPYNTGSHESITDQVQMTDYFPELTDHIDSAYRTLTDRYNRGIIGFSMGGFMSFVIAGKYPDKVSAAVSFAGSPEFYLGTPEQHTIYPVRYMFQNLQDVKIQMHNGDSDILYYLNNEVYEGSKWEGIPMNYRKFQGGHMIDSTGETKVFEMAMKFISEAFAEKAPYKPRWSHIDVYPKFTIRDYIVTSTIKTPGYVSLTNVDKSGFGIQLNKWIPDGPGMKEKVEVTTAPVYKPSFSYNIIQYDNKEIKESKKQSDEEGRLHFTFDHENIETGILENGGNSSYVLIKNGKSYLKNGKISIRLFNRGSASPQTIEVSLTPHDSGVQITNNPLIVKTKSGERIIGMPVFNIINNKKPPAYAEPPQLNFTVIIKAGKKVFHDRLIVPVLYEGPIADSLLIDDGRVIREQPFGHGNADGIANAGEQLLLYNGHHRLRLYTDDRWVIRDEEQLVDEMVPAIWPDGFTFNSIVKISPECPDGHIIEFTGSYETKEFNPIKRETHWIKVKLPVSNKK